MDGIDTSFGARSIINPAYGSVFVYVITQYLPGWHPNPHLLHRTVPYCWMDGDGPNVNECRAGWTQPACDLVPLSHHILAVCLHCIRGLCRPMPLSPVKFKLDALNSKPIFCQCQPRVLAVLLALSQRYLFPVVVQFMRVYSGRESAKWIQIVSGGHTV